MDDWVYIDQNDWVDPASLEVPVTTAPPPLVTLAPPPLPSTTEEDPVKLMALLNLLSFHSSAPLSNDYSLKTTIQSIYQIVSVSDNMSNVFNANETLWKPMFNKLQRLLSKRQVHYEQAAESLSAFISLLELSKNEQYFAKMDAAKVLLETLRNFGKKFTPLQEDVTRQVFNILITSPHLTKILAEKSTCGSVNMVNMIETIIKRCHSNDIIVKTGSQILTLCDGICFIRRDSKRKRQPLDQIPVIDNYA